MMIIVSTTLQDLQSAAGVAVTVGGSLLPMREMIRLASQSHHYLVVYDEHTREPLYCGRAKRFATSGQRIVCTRSTAAAPFRAARPPAIGVKSTTSTDGPRPMVKPTSTNSH